MDRTKSSTLVVRNQAIPAETIEAVRALSPIEQVISEHVRLRRSGAQLLGRCPFHADKTPSFSVHPAKQVFHCHGCGAGGDVFQFVQTSLAMRLSRFGCSPGRASRHQPQWIQAVARTARARCETAEGRKRAAIIRTIRCLMDQSCESAVLEKSEGSNCGGAGVTRRRPYPRGARSGLAGS